MIRWTVRVALLLSVLLFGFLALLAGTETGARQMFALARSATADRLTASTIEGTIVNGLRLTGLRYSDENFSVTIERLSIGLAPWGLIDGLIDIETIEAAQVTVHIPDTPSDQEPVRLPALRLPLRLAVQSASVTDLRLAFGEAEPDTWLQAAQLRAIWDENGIRIARLGASRPELSAELTGTLVPTGPYPLSAAVRLNVTLDDMPPIRATADVQGDLSQLRVTLATTEPLPAAASGQLSEPFGKLRWSADATAERFPLRRLAGLLPAMEGELKVQAQGSVDELTLEARLKAHSPDIGTLLASLKTNHAFAKELWTLDGLLLEHPGSGAAASASGELNLGAGKLRYVLNGDWAKLRWPLTGVANWQSPSGKFSVRGDTATIAARLDARLFDRPLQAEGVLHPRARGIAIERLKLDGPGTTASADGEWGERLDLRWDLKVAELKALLPASRGRLTWQGRLTGTAERPLIDARAAGDSLAFGDFTLATFTLDLNAGLSANDPLRLVFAADRLQSGSLRADATLQVQGTAGAHNVEGRANIDGRSIDLGARGGWSESRWRGSVQRFDISDPKAGVWRLDSRSDLVVDALQSQLRGACWVQESTRLCTDANRKSAGDWSATLRLEHLPLAFLRRFTDVLPDWRGETDGELRIAGSAAKPLNALLNLDLSESRLNLSASAGEAAALKLAPARLTARLDPSGLTAKGELNELGAVEPLLAAQVSLPGRLDPARWERQSVEATLAAHLDHLERWIPNNPALTRVGGRLNGEFRVRGTLNRPEINGGLIAENLRFTVPALGLVVSRGELRADADEVVQLRGFLGAGSSTLQLAGEMDLNQEGWPGELRIDGRRFELVRIPEARVLASPALRIHHDGGHIEATGRVEIPEALIEPAKRKSAIEASKDVVMVPKAPEAPTDQTTRLDSRVQVVLGKDVRVDGYGFKGAITGTLTVDDHPGSETRANGELRIQDGAYSYYGVDLKIEQGRIRFADSPITNPALDVVAARRLTEVKAGVRVSGQAQNPQINLFSEPSLAPADILAYIVTGGPLSQTSGQQGSTLLSAAANLGLKGGNLLFRELTDKFSLLSDIKFESATYAKSGQLDQTALMLGKYLTPRLYIQYGLGLLSPANILRVRYKLDKNWELQSETGPANSGDVFYGVER